MNGRTHEDLGRDEDDVRAELYPDRARKVPGSSSAILAIVGKRPEPPAFDEAIELPVHVVPLRGEFGTEAARTQDEINREVAGRLRRGAGGG